MEWTSVKDSLPLDGQKVIVCLKKSKCLHICLFQKKWMKRRNIFSIMVPETVCMKTLEDYIKVCILPLSKITSWMPLPKPPNEEYKIMSDKHNLSDLKILKENI